MGKQISLFQALTEVQYSVEQKALMGVTATLGLTLFLTETRLPFLLLDWLVSRFPISLLPKGNGVRFGPVFLKDSERVRHCHIVGSPGSGKTEATKLLIFEDIRRGRGCFVIDAKGDRELYDEVKAFCATVERKNDLKLLSATFPEESSTWNPCGLGNASELQSKFLNSNVFSEPFYAKACELGLLEAFNSLVEKGGGFSIPDLVNELKESASKTKSKFLEGLFFDFGSLAQSEWKPILCENNDPKKEISLLDIVQKNQILFVHLPTEGKSVQSSRIGRLITQELILISGLKKSYPALNQNGLFSVYIDEFDAFATESFITFLNKGRSSNFMIHIAHQTLSDLKKVSQEFASQVLGNCNIHLIFRQDDPDDAELWSRFIGTKTVIKKTYQAQGGTSTGATSNRESQEFIVSPDLIKNLSIGQCVASVKTAKIHKTIRLPLAPRLSIPCKTPNSQPQLEGRIRSSLDKASKIEPTESSPTIEISKDAEQTIITPVTPLVQCIKPQNKWDLLLQANSPKPGEDS